MLVDTAQAEESIKKGPVEETLLRTHTANGKEPFTEIPERTGTYIHTHCQLHYCQLLSLFPLSPCSLASAFFSFSLISSLPVHSFIVRSVSLSFPAILRGDGHGGAKEKRRYSLLVLLSEVCASAAYLWRENRDCFRAGSTAPR